MNNNNRTKNQRNENPVAKASLFSRCTFWWLKSLFTLGLNRAIEEEDIYETLDKHKSSQLSVEFSRLWHEDCAKAEKGRGSLFRVIRRIYGARIVCWGMLYTIIDTATRMFQPLCLGGLVSYFAPNQKTISKEDAYWYAFGIIISSLIPVIVFHPYIFYAFQIGMKIRLSCCSLIYEKSLKLSKSACTEGLGAQVINLMSNDVSRFDTTAGFIQDLWKGPMELMILGYLVYKEIDWYGLIGIGFLLSFIPLQAWGSRKAASFRLKTAKKTDLRVRFMNEIIQGIQVIKMYTWEKSFAEVVSRVRRHELSSIRGTLFIRGTLMSFSIVSRFSIFLSLIAYVYFGNYFTARKVFTVTSYFNFLYSSMLHFFPLSMAMVAESFIAIRRIEKFLMRPEGKTWPGQKQKADEVVEEEEKLLNIQFKGNSILANGKRFGDESPQIEADIDFERSIINRNGVFLHGVTALWSERVHDSSTGIVGVDLTVEQNELCAVVGSVGSGKTTLLQVILNELATDCGSVRVNGTVSYAAQEPWLFEGSIRNNIIFIEEFDVKRYREIIKVCALERDLELFPHGDSTIVGERGVSLSGGQRARVNLARAIYKKADIYLLDDPLSAVDTHVGKHIFEKCIREYLKDKICILVTHQLQYLKDVEHIVLFDSGRISAYGTLQHLKTTKSYSLLSLNESDSKEDTFDDTINVTKNPIRNQVMSTDKPQENKETQASGSVGFSVYRKYLKSVQSCFLFLVCVVLFIGTQTSMSGVDYFVSEWVNWEEAHATNTTPKPMYRLANNNRSVLSMNGSDTRTYDSMEADRLQFIYIYAGTMVAVLCLTLNRSYAFFHMCLRASMRLHDKLFHGVTRACIVFFNSNPSGRILNRFSRDIGCIDTQLPAALMDCIVFFLELIAIITLVAIANYWLLVPTVVMSILFYALRHIYVNTARSIKRLEAMTRSPIYSHTNATLQGLSTIRASKAQQVMINEFNSHLDLNTSSWYLFLATTRAFALWLEMVCVLYITAVTMSFLVLDSDALGGRVGLAITQVFNLIFMCQWGMRQTAELENQMTSVERVLEYTYLPSEPPLKTLEKLRPPLDWPQFGEVRFVQLSLRYSKDSDLVLKNLNFCIEPKEKIGIVGRTGAGKSSIIQAMFRLAINEGTILIDGIDISTLGLHDLRSKISIIPQDPVLFSGTLRINLDPFESKTDDEIWSALSQVELKQAVSNLPEGLDSKMADGGSNFSMGQRQLVCLARAILRNNKILILDEATANVDPETDKLIQTTIRTKFSEFTVLTIAHRLHTVMDSNRVLVVDAGKVVEFAHPYELLSRPGSYLRALVNQTGVSTAGQLIRMAEQNYLETKKRQENL